MAGSYRHVTNDDGTFDESMKHLENMRDMAGAVHEMWHMIQTLSGGDPAAIKEAEFQYHKSQRIKNYGSCDDEDLRRVMEL